MEEKKKSNVGLLVFLLILVLGLAGYIGYFKLYIKPDEPAKEEKEKENSREEIDFDASKYLGYVPLEKNSFIYLCSWGLDDTCKDKYEYLDAYSKDKVTVDDISDRLLLNTALLYSTKANESEYFESDFDICGKDSNGNQLTCTVSEYYKASEVLNNVKKLYNKDITPQDFVVPSGFAYYKNNYFALAFSAGNSSVEKISNMESAEIVNGDLVITERAIFIYDMATKNGDTIEIVKKTDYSLIDPNDIIYSYGVEQNVDIETYPGGHAKMLEDAKNTAVQKISESNLFKHTFKRNSQGEYYWYSTEIVK